MINKNKLFYLSHPFTTFGDPELNITRAMQIEKILNALHGIKVINPIMLPLGDTNDIAMEKCM